MRRLYFEDYIKTWDRYLDDVKLVKLNDPDRAMAVSRVLSAVDSPLASYLRGVSAETKLVEAPSAANALDKARAEAAALAGAAPAAGRLGRAAGTHGRRPFRGIQRLVTGDPPPINETLKLFADLNAQLAAVDAAKKSKAPPPPAGGAEKVKAAAAQQPDMVRGMVEQMADAAIGQSRGAEREGLTTELKPITEICTRSINGRYPFASGSKADVLPEDFGQLFGAGGLFDDFFQRRLAPLVDQSAAVWVYRPLTDGTRPVSPEALAEFQRAQRIRDVFFRSGGKVPNIRIEIRLSELEPTLKELVFDIDGQVQKLTTGGPSLPLSAPSSRLASVINMYTASAPPGTVLPRRRAVGAVPAVRELPHRTRRRAREVQRHHDARRQARAARSRLRQRVQPVPACAR